MVTGLGSDVFFVPFMVSIFMVQEISANFHGKTPYPDERMPVTMVVAIETLVNFGYGPRHGPWMTATYHIQNEQ